MLIKKVISISKKLYHKLQNWPLTYIFFGILGIFWTLFWSYEMYYFREAPKHTYDYIPFDEYQAGYTEAMWYTLICLISSIYMWYLVYKFFKNKK